MGGRENRENIQRERERIHTHRAREGGRERERENRENIQRERIHTHRARETERERAREREPYINTCHIENLRVFQGSSAPQGALSNPSWLWADDPTGLDHVPPSKAPGWGRILSFNSLMSARSSLAFTKHFYPTGLAKLKQIHLMGTIHRGTFVDSYLMQ
jgi:hypothetical protein